MHYTFYGANISQILFKKNEFYYNELFVTILICLKVFKGKKFQRKYFMECVV